jgi:hypothetical protein
MAFGLLGLAAAAVAASQVVKQAEQTPTSSRGGIPQNARFPTKGGAARPVPPGMNASVGVAPITRKIGVRTFRACPKSHPKKRSVVLLGKPTMRCFK